MSLDDLSSRLVGEIYGKQNKGTLPVESCTGDNCGDALANFLNSGPLKDTGLSLPRGGVGPGDLAGVGKARGASVLGRGDLSLDSLTPGTVIHMTRKPGDRNYEYGSTHIGIVDEDEQGNKMFKSFTAGKGWRTEAIDQRFIDRLPAQITATNPVNPGSGGWLAKAGNLLGPSAAHAGEIPKGSQGQEEDLATRLTNQLYGEEPGQEDLATKLTNQLYGEETKVALAPAVPVPTKSSTKGLLYSQDIPGSRIHGLPSVGLPAPGVSYDELGMPVTQEPRTKSVMMTDKTYNELSKKYPVFREEKILTAPEEPRSLPRLQRTESIWKDTSKTLGERLLESTASAEIPPSEVEADSLKGELHRPVTYPLISAERSSPFALINKNIAAVNRPILESLVGYAGIVENALAIPYQTISGDRRPIARPLTLLAKELKAMGAPEYLEPVEGEYWATLPGQVMGGLAAYMLPGKFIPKGGTSLFERYLHNLGTFLPADVARGYATGGEEGAKRGLYSAVPTAAAFTLAQTLPNYRAQALGVGTVFAGSAYVGGERDPHKLTADFLIGVGLHWLGTRGEARREKFEEWFEEWKKDKGVGEQELKQIKEDLSKPVPESALEPKTDIDKLIIEDVQIAGEAEVKKTEVVEEVPTVVDEVKPKPLTAVERARAKKTKEGVKVEDEVKVEPEPKPTPKPKVIPTPPERTVIETDPQTSSFRQDPEVTRVRTQTFSERNPRDLLSIHAKALNDVNRWLDGDKEVSIDQTRRLLSDLAAKVEDPAHDRTMLDMLGTPSEVELFKKISKESATWARRVKREKGGRVKEDVVPEVTPIEEQTPTSKIDQSIEQKLEAPEVAEKKVKELTDNEAWRQAEEDAKVAEDTRFTKDAIEKYYGKGLDELSDKEVISYMEKELLGKGGGTELYSGIPVHLIGKTIKNYFRPSKEELPGHEDFKVAQGVKKPDGKYQWKVLGLNSKTGKWDELNVFETKKEARTNSIQRAVDASVEWTKLYREKMNDPLMQPEAAIAHKKAERAQRNQDAMREFKEGNLTKWWDSQKKFWGEAIHDQAGRVRSALLKHFGEDGQRLLSYTESVPGGARYGEERANQMRREVEAGLSKKMLKHLFDYHMYTRYMDIWKDHPKWKIPVREAEIAPTKAEVVMQLSNFKEYKKLSNAEFELIRERSELMFEHMRGWIDDSLLASGIIGPKEAKDLKDHRYTKMKSLQTWADVFDVKSKYQVGDQKTTNYDSGIQRIKGGGLSIVETDQFLVYTEVARTLFGRAANQRARQAMREFATQFPDNGMIWHKGLGGKKPKGGVKDYVFGFETPVESVETSYPTRQPIWLHPDFAHQVTTVGYEMSARFSAIAGKAFGGDLVRALAVGISPVWATIVNLPIDILHTFFSPRIFKDGKEVGKSNAEAIFSPFFPKYLKELGENYVSVASDVWNRGDKYQAYARYGGLLQFLTQRQSHVTGQMKRPGKFDELLDILSAHGRNTELLTRLAIMDRVVEQKAGELGMTKEDLWKRENAKSESEILRLATHIARENMPYGQTGWMIKALDRFIPFMGANYVGGKTFWRAAVERKADFAIRIANIGAAAVSITALGLLYNPEVYRKIDDDDKIRNVIIPYLPESLQFKDSKGNMRNWLMAIPGAGGPMFFYNLFAGLTHKFMYETGMTKLPHNFDATIKSLLQNAPAQSFLPPVLSGLVSLTTNYSMWRNDTVFKELGGKSFNWPYSEVEGMNDPNVSQIAKGIGKITKLSPKRLQAFWDELFPVGNEFVWLGGKICSLLYNSVPEKLRERVWQEEVATAPGLRRLFKLTKDGAYRETGEASRERQESEVEVRNYQRRSEFKLIMEEKARGGNVNEKLNDFFAKLGQEDPEVAKRYMKDITKLSMIEQMEHKSMWRGMLGKSDELKAADVYERMKVETSPEEQESLGRELGTLMAAKFIGKGFMRELNRLRGQDNK